MSFSYRALLYPLIERLADVFTKIEAGTVCEFFEALDLVAVDPLV
jgi:hypothetical protein